MLIYFFLFYFVFLFIYLFGFFVDSPLLPLHYPPEEKVLQINLSKGNNLLQFVNGLIDVN